MEKKSSSRSSQSQTKPQTNESKKLQDTSVGKPWPRWNKKRESSNASGKNENNRKPPPKTKNFDKRPRPRGTFCEGRITRTRLEDESAEVGSVFLPGSKKQNLNHLLNFQYTPRGGGGGVGRPSNRRHGLVYTNTHKHNNELFLQSNCQFVVKASGDFQIHLSDPDTPVSWDLIEQINVRVSEPLSCPICLCELVAGQITRCGHAYCWPCLLHYFALSEDSHRSCPICFQPIDKTKLKSVQGVWQNTVSQDGEINFTLMRRAQGSTIVEPAPELGTEYTSPGDILSVSHIDTTLFAKLLTANKSEVSKIIQRERNELMQQLSNESDDPEFCFVHQALELLQIRESFNICEVSEVKEAPECIQKPITVPTPTHNTVDVNMPGGLDFTSNFHNMTLNETDVTNNNDSPTPNTTEVFDDFMKDDFDLPLNMTTAPNTGLSQVNENDSSRFVYFYQASDGQAVFLEGLEIRMLEMSWGNLRNAPRTLHGRLLKRTSGSVSDEARRRLRCLRHLPIHCPYDLVQVELKAPFVSPDSLNAFKCELEERKRQRQRRAREEKRLERAVTRQEHKLLGQTRGMQLSLDSDVHFPVYQPEPVDTLSSQHFPSCLEGDNDEETPRSSVSEGSSTNLSFAKMASTSGTWRSRVNEAQRAPPTAPTARVRCDSETSDTLEAAPPLYNVSLSDAISAALLNREGGGDNSNRKKKKKQKHKVLFATGIQHHASN